MPLFLEAKLKKQYPGTSRIFIENRVNGAAAIATLERQMPGINKVNPSRSKYDRAFASSDELNALNWYLPHPQLASWVDEFLFELSAFPRGRHDDWLDAFTQAREVLSGGVAGLEVFNDANMMHWDRVNAQLGYSPGRLAALRRWPF